MDSLEQLPSQRGPRRAWQPGYVLYGGAQLFSAETPTKMVHLARKWMKEYPWLSEAAKKRVESALAQPLEDLRIDFEDGYGWRSAEEEDGHAQAVARALPQVLDVRRIGIRVKPITRETAERAWRTLGLCLSGLGVWPPGFCITLPKVEEVSQLQWLLSRLPELEAGRPALPIEIMVESPRGLQQLPQLIAAGGSRLRGVHFGPYDFLSSCGISQLERHHPLNVQARLQMLLMAGDLEVSDGPTTQLPVPPHRQAQGNFQLSQDNLKAVRAAWELHREEVLQARRQGYPQGWLLHPSQLVSHWAALLQESETAYPTALERLNAWFGQGGVARTQGNQFDDTATVRIWARAVGQAIDLGLLDESQVARGWRDL